MFCKIVRHLSFLFLCSLTNTHAAIQEISSANLIGRSILAINQSGQYLITQDVDFAEKPIVISANNVELDLGGHTITFSKLNPYGILFTAGSSNIIIKNGTILNSSPEALNISNNNITLSDLNITAANTTGIAIVNSNNIRITSVTLTGSLRTGISITTAVDIEVKNCTLKSIITKSFTGIHVLNSETITCSGNAINTVQTKKDFYGFRVEGSSRVILSQNILSMNTGRACTAIRMANGHQNTVSQNNIFMNSTRFLQQKTAHIGVVVDRKQSHMFIGIDIDPKEQQCVVMLNNIRDNRGSYGAYGLLIRERFGNDRRIHIEKNDISTNHGHTLQYGIYDGDNLSQNTYLRNRVSFHGQCLDGSSMPSSPEPKANYFMQKNCPIFNLIKEASADELGFLKEDEDKNLSIYGTLSGVFHG